MHNASTFSPSPSSLLLAPFVRRRREQIPPLHSVVRLARCWFGRPRRHGRDERWRSSRKTRRRVIPLGGPVDGCWSDVSDRGQVRGDGGELTCSLTDTERNESVMNTRGEKTTRASGGNGERSTETHPPSSFYQNLSPPLFSSSSDCRRPRLSSYRRRSPVRRRRLSQ